jgi:putative tricarboxylic transport membrane protein
VGLDNGAMALGIILGPMIDENFGICVNLSKAHGDSVLQVFWQSNIALLLVFCTVLPLLTPFFLDWKRKRMNASENQQQAKEKPHAQQRH